MQEKSKVSKQLAPLWPYVRKRWHLLVGIVVAVITGVGANLLVSRELGASVDFGLAGDMSGFLRSLLVIVVASTISDGAFFTRSALAGRVAEQICHQLRVAAVTHLSHAKPQALQGTHSGDYTSRLSNDLTLVRALFASEAVMLIRAPLQCALSLGLMLLVSWRLTLLSVAIIPLLMLLSNRVSQPINAQSQIAQAELSKVTALSQDAIQGTLVTKTFNLQQTMADRYCAAGQRHVSAAISLAGSQATLRAVSFLIDLAPLLVLFGLGGYEVIRGRLSLGDIIVLLNLVGNLSWPLQMMVQAMGRVKATGPAVARTFAIFDLPLERSGGSSPVTTPAAEAAIEVADLHFSYGDEQPVLNRFNLRVNTGETVAIVGPSGAGKSTLLSLLLGLLEPDAGEIRVNGQSAADLTLAHLRSQFCYVPQEPTLFAASVRDNIRLGRPEATNELVLAAARQAFAHEFISALPAGYDTILGENGQGLSGGQKQRIAIARAFLQDAPILLLDEATSALDTESEARIQLATEALRQGRTMLVVAHRLSTIQSADRIAVLDQGRVVELGRHADLIEQSGLYASLYEKQLSCQEHNLAANS